jgi:hypothetical protein
VKIVWREWEIGRARPRGWWESAEEMEAFGGMGRVAGYNGE